MSMSRKLIAKLVEDIETPSEGIFYYCRVPSGWILLGYRYAERRPADHVEYWPEVARIVAGRWCSTVTESDDVKALAAKFMALRQGKGAKSSDAVYKKIVDLPYAFPRGRVSEVEEGEYVVQTGNDWKKTGISKAQVEKLFGIEGKCSWQLDRHEQCLAGERDEIISALGIKDQPWPAERYPVE